MDAAQTNFKKISLFLAPALLLLAPVPGFAQPTLTVSTTKVVIGSSDCNHSQNVFLTSSNGTDLAFIVKVQYSGSTPDIQDQYGNWLYANIDNFGRTSNGTFPFSAHTGTTGISLTIGLNLSIGAVSPSATVVVTPTNGTPPVNITAFYAQNTSCGGNTGVSQNGFISITPGNVALTAAPGGQQSQTLTIQNLTGTAFTGLLYSVQGGTWLSASATSTTLSANGTALVTVTGDASKLSGTGSVSGIVTVTPPSGFGTTLNIPVTFVVGTGSGGNSSGTLTVNGATSSTYNTSFTLIAANPPASLCVPLQDTAPGANNYTYQVSTATGGAWLLANFNTSGTTPILLAPGGPACVDLRLSNVANTLPSGSYQGSVALTSSSGATAAIAVSLFVSAGAAPGITVSPSLVYTFQNVAVGSVVLQQQAFTITAATGYNLGTAIASSTPGWFSMSAPSSNGNNESFTVTANPTGLSAGLYSTTVTLSSSGASGGTTTILISLPVGQAGATTGVGPGTGVTSLVAPTTLEFQQQSGNNFWTGGQEAQSITITGQQGTPWSATIIYGPGGTGWLNFDNLSSGSGTFGTTPVNLVVDLFNGVQSLAPSTTPYQANVNITTPSGLTSVAVSVLVTPATTPVLLGRPAIAIFPGTGSQVVQVVGSDNTGSATSPLLITGPPSVSWLTATPTGNSLTLSVNATGQATGVYWGTVPVSSSAYPNVLDYPVVLIVNGGGGGASSGPLTLSTTSISFTNVTGLISQTLNVAATTSTGVTPSTSEQSCTTFNWLGITPSGPFTAGSVNTPVSVNVSPAGIANGTTCAGTISLVTPAGTQTVAVSMVVGPSGGSGNITVSPLQMTFAYTQNQTVPPAQTATIVNATQGTPAIPFTVTTAVSGSVANWLQTSAATGQTPFNNPGLSVSVVPGTLQAGTYQGTVTITPTGGTAQVINATLTVTATATVSATPTTLSLNYLVGGASPTATVLVSAGGSTANFTATATSSSGFLQVSPTSGTTPNTGTANLTVSLVPTVAATLLPGSYTGTVTIAGTSPATGTTIVNVTLSITAPLPTITKITNAGSFAIGPVSPGEIISLFADDASKALGPSTAVQLDSTTCPSPCTQVPTTMGGVTVTFLPIGVKAPLTYVSAGQINAVVPYEIATAGSNLSVQVKYLGQTSNAFPVQGAATATGIFTSGLGTGQAAAGMYDTTGTYRGVNTASNPAQRGWVLAIYMTGDGVLNPPATTGSVTKAFSTPPFLPQPNFVPVVRIDNQPATVAGYGESNGFVSGVLQVNVIVPQAAGSGSVGLTISLGNTSSQAGLTVAVQ